MWFNHYFRRPVQWRNLSIVGLVVDSRGATLLDEYGREVRWLHERHL